MSKLFIQVFDKEYINELKAMGLKVINDKNENFTLMTLNEKVNFNSLDNKKVKITNKMMF